MLDLVKFAATVLLCGVSALEQAEFREYGELKELFGRTKVYVHSDGSCKEARKRVLEEIVKINEEFGFNWVVSDTQKESDFVVLMSCRFGTYNVMYQGLLVAIRGQEIPGSRKGLPDEPSDSKKYETRYRHRVIWEGDRAAAGWGGRHPAGTLLWQFAKVYREATAKK